MKIALALVVAYHVHSVLLPLTSPLHPKPDAGRIVAGHEGGSPGEVGASLDALVDELIAELDSAPNIAHTSGRMPPNCTAEFARLADEGGNDPHLSVLIRKLERWVNGYGVMVHWLPSCPVEPGQLWVGIYEPGSFRIRVCPLRSVAEKFDVLLHESGHLLQDRVFKHTFDQHEADAISWLVQRRLGIPVAFSTTGHMRGVYGSTSQDIRRRRDTIIRGATIILSALQ